MQTQIHSRESDLQSQEDELTRTKVDLGRLQEEESQLEQSLLAGQVQLDSIIKSLKATQDEINQVSTAQIDRTTGPESIFVTILQHLFSSYSRPADVVFRSATFGNFECIYF